ncbi:ABC transporter ATP-binding protein [Caldinitratiruptor microaerophilus]|uniref:ABC transporter ATP-binding protein n=1 Tax=Caldinitratiruptor microaerophilus TaxID=671077 RepID=UPI0022327403|nr:ABC transporter ATP-binding protein [Caldinitratiruptor microaerophilus]
MPLLVLQDIWRTYRDGAIRVDALRGVDLTVEDGEFVSIMGPSGSGKSTLLNIIGCLDRPTSGVYTLAGQRVDGLADVRLAAVRNRFIGFIFQEFRLLPDLDALGNVALPLIYRGVPARERRRRAEEALAAVGLADRGRHRPSQLSGGEKQRVAIARALVADPALILADEPTGALDSANGRAIMAIFQRLNRERGLTVVQVTHDPTVARHGTRIVHLRDGAVEREEAVAEPLVAQENAAGGEG